MSALAPVQWVRLNPWVRVLRLEYQGDNFLIWFGATALAATAKTFHCGWFLVGLVMLVLAQAALELLDGYYDDAHGAHGVKHHNAPRWTGGSGVLAAGLLSPTSVKKVAWTCGLLATALFIWVTAERTGWAGFAIGLAGAVAGAGWAMPPLKLSYRGLGEITQGVVLGPLMAAQAWTIASGHFEWKALLVGLPFGALELAMGLLNNFIDRESDARASKKNWVVRHGAQAGAVAHAAALTLGFAFHAYLVWVGTLPMLLACCLLPATLAWNASRKVFAVVRSPSAEQAQRLAAEFPTYGVVTAYGLTFVFASLAWLSQREPEISLWLAVAFALCYAPVLGVLWARRI